MIVERKKRFSSVKFMYKQSVSVTMCGHIYLVFSCLSVLLFSSGSFLSAVGRRSSADFHAEDPNLCLSLREDEEQRQLLCNDRRSKFNYNPFGLRFGKRYNSFMLRRAVHRPRNTGFFPLELEVST